MPESSMCMLHQLFLLPASIASFSPEFLQHEEGNELISTAEIGVCPETARNSLINLTTCFS